MGPPLFFPDELLLEPDLADVALPLVPPEPFDADVFEADDFAVEVDLPGEAPLDLDALFLGDELFAAPLFLDEPPEDALPFDVEPELPDLVFEPADDPALFFEPDDDRPEDLPPDLGAARAASTAETAAPVTAPLAAPFTTSPTTSFAFS